MYSVGLCVTMKFSTPIIIVMVGWIGNNKTFQGDNAIEGVIYIILTILVHAGLLQ